MKEEIVDYKEYRIKNEEETRQLALKLSEKLQPPRQESGQVRDSLPVGPLGPGRHLEAQPC